ncbi:FecR family protein [Chitinophaga niabensis]|uniref:FecR protein n=1 Tax=Chitinophaga niabensis TaxID=536979 RepID=A0A1N6KEX9_9BACT|nr:FecR family protein [Chitinophaga niabensis]SIO55111.1 FecR protein [Chitinophaga niabensis]
MSIQQQERLSDLLTRYYKGNLAEADAEELSFYLKDDRNNDTIRQVLTGLSAEVAPAEVDMADMQRLIRNVKEVSSDSDNIRRLSFTRIAAAAAVLLMLGIGGYFLLIPPAEKRITVKRYKDDVQPGGNKAMLTLSDGSTISLEDAQQGSLAQQGGSQVIKSADGELAYNKNGLPGEEIQYNTLTTPLGGQYRITLPDGTSVWLNAGSSLRYPTAFTGKDRKVELKGEGYFDVAKNATMPFYVMLNNGVEVRVLGTQFNVNAYSDEKNIATTLVEGAVLVKNKEIANVLQPGQQSLAGQNDNTLKLVKNADIAAVTAWKEGVFKFNDAEIETVMKQLSRWYDIEIVYEGNPVKEYFNGTIPRNVPVSKVLELLELTGLVHFKIEGKRIIVTS